MNQSIKKMETVKMTNEKTCGNYEFPANAGESGIKLTGEYKVTPAGKLDSLSGNIMRGNNYAGNFNISPSNGARRMHLNLEYDSVSNDVVSGINALIDEIELKYKPVNADV